MATGRGIWKNPKPPEICQNYPVLWPRWSGPFSLNCRHKEIQLRLCKDFGSIVKCFDWGFVRSCLFFVENSMYFFWIFRQEVDIQGIEKEILSRQKWKDSNIWVVGRGLLRLENKVRGGLLRFGLVWVCTSAS